MLIRVACLFLLEELTIWLMIMFYALMIKILLQQEKLFVAVKSGGERLCDLEQTLPKKTP